MYLLVSCLLFPRMSFPRRCVLQKSSVSRFINKVSLPYLYCVIPAQAGIHFDFSFRHRPDCQPRLVNVFPVGAKACPATEPEAGHPRNCQLSQQQHLFHLNEFTPTLAFVSRKFQERVATQLAKQFKVVQKAQKSKSKTM